MPEGRWQQADGDQRSRMARATDAQPPRPYVYRGTGVDIMHGATGTLEDVRRMLGYHEESAPDPGPAPDWYRELADEYPLPASQRPALAAVPDPAPDPAPEPEPDPGSEPSWTDLPPPAPGDGTATIVLDDPEASPEPAPAQTSPTAARCRNCGYPPGTIGHRISCGDDPPPVTAASAPPVRCTVCGYLTGTVGHKVACGE